MFDLSSMDNEEKEELKYNFIEHEEFEDKELLSMEKEMLGIYISGHPLDKIRETLIRVTNINTIKMKETKEELDTTGTTTKYKDGQIVKFAGIITNIKKKYTKSNKLMGFITIEDLYGTAEIIAFENAYQNASNLLLKENVVLVEGRLSIREDDEVKIVARDIKDLNSVGVALESEKHKKILIDITKINEEDKAKLRGALKFFNGEKNNTPVQVKNGESILSCGSIYMNKEILDELTEIVSKENIFIQ